MQEKLAAFGVDYSGCVEKKDILALLERFVEPAASGPSSSGTSGAAGAGGSASPQASDAGAPPAAAQGVPQQGAGAGSTARAASSEEAKKKEAKGTASQPLDDSTKPAAVSASNPAKVAALGESAAASARQPSALKPGAAAAPEAGKATGGSSGGGVATGASGGGGSGGGAAAAAAAVAAAPVTLPPGWKENRDASGRIYYYNESTRISRWDVPTGAAAEKIAARQAAEEEEAARRLEARRAELREAQERDAAAQEEASQLRSALRKTIAAWAEGRGWSGRKQLRKAIRMGAVGGDTLPKRIMLSLLVGLADVPVAGWKEGSIMGTFTCPALPAGWVYTSTAGADAVKEAALRKAYTLAVRCLHPDKTQSLHLALRLAGEEVFGIVNEAWEAYKDHESGALTAAASSGGAGDEPT